ncbi:transcription factor HHO5 isoform X2 [Diospyros lotus]|uniref:transcription factor HHO5 isoform X2 n=1 Tax=Diospyros lotus TaxID=55363 RepID=UPI002251B98D|nr:transcription factor HHO5 isoform X2 [Diospyros lotus]
MGENPMGLNLELGLNFVPTNTIDVSEKSPKPSGRVQVLEDELRKIQAFERELPLCMLILNDAIRRVKAETSSDLNDKKNWMSSARLWTNSTGFKSENKLNNSALDLKLSGPNPKREKAAPPAGEMMKPESKQKQPQKKQRRCWSPELHGRFVSALEQLGGAQIATPKHIRQLMQVDGLTNDEVKSHLQKYRIHVRKLPASPTTTSTVSWMSMYECGDGSNSKASNSQSGSPLGPFQLGGSAKAVSTTTHVNSIGEEEDEKSESHNWKGQLKIDV